MTPPVLIIPHIAKTGGTSVREHAIRHLTMHETFIHLGPWGIKQARRLGLQDWQDRPEQERLKARLVMGHGVTLRGTAQALPNARLSYATCLRDPAARWVSDFNFNKRKTGSLSKTDTFWDFYGRYSNPNFLCTFLWHEFMQQPYAGNQTMLDGVTDLLETFAFVGTTETYESFAQFVCGFLNLPAIEKKYNVSGVDHEKIQMVTRDIEERLRDDCRFDYALYDRFASRLT